MLCVLTELQRLVICHVNSGCYVMHPFLFIPTFFPPKNRLFLPIVSPLLLSFQEKPCGEVCPAEESPQVSPCQANSDFSHPVYKEIAVTNGHINRMSQNELRKKLAELQLDTR